MSTQTSVVTGVDFVTVPVSDYDAAAEFYGSVLGLPFVKRWGNLPAGEFQAGNLTLALVQPDAFGREFRQSNAWVALQVDDVAASRAELESKGIEFERDTIDSGVCHMAMFSDPDGTTLILHHRYAPKGEVPPAAA
jgi:catechol 2,3-dioxygenase-like lactoylglutathione lyase family enzyme